MSKNNLIGATLIIAGTTIGAGMLALPMTSMSIGFINSSIVLIAIWGAMYSAALITLDLNLFFGGGVSVAAMSARVFGKAGSIISSSALMMLFYSLLAAYITGGSSLIQNNVQLDISQKIIAVVFTLFFGFFVNFHIKSVDYINRIMFIIKIMTFVLLLSLMVFNIEPKRLTVMPEVSNNLWMVIPVFFTSFGFHGSLPSLINYLDKNRVKLKSAIFVGSLIPLIVYLLWQTCTLGVLAEKEISKISASSELGVFINCLSEAIGNHSIKWMVNIFAFLAIATSFLGVAIGLFDFVAESFEFNNNPIERIKTSALTFLPPLLFSLYYPEGFIMALRYAAVFLSFLAIFIPVLLALKLRSKGFKGHNSSIFVSLACGLAVILIELGILG